MAKKSIIDKVCDSSVNEAIGKTPRKVRNSKPNPTTVTNGLADALGYNSPFNQGAPGAQINELETLETNLRFNFISNNRQLLSQLYAEYGLIQTVVNVPVDDAFRGGVDITTKQLDEDQLHELQTAIEREQDLQKVSQAMKWSRLYGGGAVMIMTDQDCESPLDLDSITEDSLLEFRALDLWELFWSSQNVQYNDQLQLYEGDFYNYYGKKVHKSRVMSVKGMEAPSFIRPRLRGWGFSVVECFVRSINQYIKSTGLCFELLDEAKIDVYKIKDLTNTLLSPQGDAAVQKRIQLANYQKNYQNAISMDAEDSWEQKIMNFAGLSDIQNGIRIQVAADLRMPLTKIFGESSAGFNNGQDSIEIYNSMIQGEIRVKSKYDIIRVIEIRCQKLFGFIPDDISIEFKPLRILSTEQEESAKTQKFNRLLQAQQAGQITTLEFRNSCNRGKLFDILLTNEEISDMSSPDTQKKKEVFEENNQLENSKYPMGESLEFLKKTFELEGPAAYVSPEELELMENPGRVDEALWKKAKDASMDAFHEIRWPFVSYLYKKWGGKFN